LKTLANGGAARDEKEQLWVLCVDVVDRLAARYTRFQPQQREDYFSEGYLKFEQALSTFEPERGVPFRAYLRRCVSNHFQDLKRKRGSRSVQFPDDLPDIEVDFLAGLRNEEIAQQVEEVLGSLLPRDRQRERKIMAFRLRMLEAWTPEQIRGWLKVKNANLVSQWIHRVRKAFMAEFPRRYPEYFEDLTGEGGLGLVE